MDRIILNADDLNIYSNGLTGKDKLVYDSKVVKCMLEDPSWMKKIAPVCSPSVFKGEGGNVDYQLMVRIILDYMDDYGTPPSYDELMSEVYDKKTHPIEREEMDALIKLVREAEINRNVEDDFYAFLCRRQFCFINSEVGRIINGNTDLEVIRKAVIKVSSLLDKMDMVHGNDDNDW